MFLSWNAVFFDGLNTNGSITNIPMEVVAWPIQSSLSVSFFYSCMCFMCPLSQAMHIEHLLIDPPLMWVPARNSHEGKLR
jgi:hypothetical protein